MSKITVGISYEINKKFIFNLKKKIKAKNIVFKIINKNDSDDEILEKLIGLDIFITKYFILSKIFFKTKNNLKLLQLTTSDYSSISIDRSNGIK